LADQFGTSKYSFFKGFLHDYFLLRVMA
jgi:hypothetical protein